MIVYAVLIAYNDLKYISYRSERSLSRFYSLYEGVCGVELSLWRLGGSVGVGLSM